MAWLGLESQIIGVLRKCWVHQGLSQNPADNSGVVAAQAVDVDRDSQHRSGAGVEPPGNDSFCRKVLLLVTAVN